MKEQDLLLEIDSCLNELHSLANEDYFDGSLYKTTIWKIRDYVKKLIEEHNVDYADNGVIKRLELTINNEVKYFDCYDSQMNKSSVRKRDKDEFRNSMRKATSQIKKDIEPICQKIKELHHQK